MNWTNEPVTEENADTADHDKSNKEFPPVSSTENIQLIEGLHSFRVPAHEAVGDSGRQGQQQKPHREKHCINEQLHGKTELLLLVDQLSRSPALFSHFCFS
jgi:hypothetical protein